MSIIKFGNGKNRGPQSLKQAVDYILNPEKTNRELVVGNGINTNQAARDMETIQTLYGKNSGRAYIHYIISFDKGVSAEKARNVSEKCAAYYADDYQYIMAIHTNTENVHAHIVLNAVNVHSGNKFSQSKADMLRYREYVNKVLLKYGLAPIGKKAEERLWCDEGILEEDMYYEDIFLNDIPEDYEDNESSANGSFFGDEVDEEECSLIEEAESEAELVKRIIRYFEGEEYSLPPNVSYEDAEIIYWQWTESQQYDEEF